MFSMILLKFVIIPRDLFALVGGDKSVTVLGVFGKCELGLSGGRGWTGPRADSSKEGMLDRVLQRDVFWIASEEEEGQGEDNFDPGRRPYIQGYVDRSARKVYLNLRGFLDASALAAECAMAAKEVEEEVWKDCSQSL